MHELRKRIGIALISLGTLAVLAARFLHEEQTEAVYMNISMKDKLYHHEDQHVLDQNRFLETQELEEHGGSSAIEVEYQEIYAMLVFLATVFAMGKISAAIGMPSLVGEIFCGFLLGPPLADFVPFSKAVVLVGEIGLIMLLLEAGIDIDVAALQETGTRAILVACTGSVLPLVVGIGLSIASGSNIRTAIAVGACFSPTSLGVASNALSAGGMLNTPIGQLIVASCVLDDIIALIILSIIMVLVDEEAELYEYFIPIISAFGFLIILGYFALTWIPKLIEKKILPLFPEHIRDLAAFGMMFALLMGYLPLLFYTKASYLTGAFLAGLSFSQIHSVHKSFVHNTQNLMKWLLRIFFAATIGFQVPVKEFWHGKVIGWGFLFYLCVLMKLPLGLFVPTYGEAKKLPYNPRVKDTLILGLAMTCRGEFSFIIAAFSIGEGLFDQTLYSSIIWAILISCITSPFALLFTIKYYNKKCMSCITDAEGKKSGQVPLNLVIQCRTKLKWGLQDQLTKCAVEAGLIVLDQRSWHPRGFDAVVVSELYVSDTTMKVSHPASEEEVSRITDRCTDIRSLMMNTIAQISAEVNVTQWFPIAIESRSLNDSDEEDQLSSKLIEEARTKLRNNEEIDTLLDKDPIQSQAKKVKTLSGSLLELQGNKKGNYEDIPSLPAVTEEETVTEQTSRKENYLRRRRQRMLSVPAFRGSGLWEGDKETNEIAMRSSYVPTVMYDTSIPAFGVASRKKQVSDLSQLIEHEMLPTVEEHLEGFVRRQMPKDEAKEDPTSL